MHFLGIELFLDDEMIAYTRGMRRQIRPPQKHAGNPILTEDYPWENCHLAIYGSVLPDEQRGVLRMWYNAFADPYFENQMMAYAESQDGIQWTKPMMEHVTWPGHEKTNLVMGPDPNLHGPCVIRNPDQSDPQKRFLLLFDSYPKYHAEAAAMGLKDRACYAAESPDGFRWSPAKGRFAFEGKADSGQCVIWEPRVQKFRAYARLTAQDTFGQRIRIFRLVESPDFVHWDPPSELFRPDAEDGWPDTQLQQLAVTRFDGLYVGLLGLFRVAQYLEKRAGASPPASMRTGIGPVDEGNQLDDYQLVTSRDGVNFSRVADRALFLPKSEPPKWGNGGQRMASHMVIHRDQVLIYYASRAQNHEGNPAEQMDIGLATFPRDRFVAFVPARLREEGMIELVPLIYGDEALRLNATMLADGCVRAELADFVGATIPGFEADRAVPITESGLDQIIQWKNGAGAVTHAALGQKWKGKPVRLRLWVRHAHVHALRGGA